MNNSHIITTHQSNKYSNFNNTNNSQIHTPNYNIMSQLIINYEIKHTHVSKYILVDIYIYKYKTQTS